MKRVFDFLVSLFLLILLGPLMVIVGVLIALDSPGGAFYKQKRIGLGGREFTILKFRSMVSGADKKGGYSTLEGDARITKMGRIVRKTSLDELPQLVNVLKGEMSLVGPRPDTPMQKENYSDEEWEKRCSVRPGITGLSQAKLRSLATPEEKRNLDLEYVDKSSLSLDFEILMMTIKQVVGRKGTN